MPGRKALKKANQQERERITALTDNELMTLIPGLHKEIAELSKPVGVLKARLRIVTEELRSRRTNRAGFRISDHAVVRYMERVKGVNVEAVRDEILTLALEAKGGRHRRKHDNGLTFAMDEESQIVSTVLTDREISHLTEAD